MLKFSKKKLFSIQTKFIKNISVHELLVDIKEEGVVCYLCVSYRLWNSVMKEESHYTNVTQVFIKISTIINHIKPGHLKSSLYRQTQKNWK